MVREDSLPHHQSIKRHCEEHFDELSMNSATKQSPPLPATRGGRLLRGACPEASKGSQ